MSLEYQNFLEVDERVFELTQSIKECFSANSAENLELLGLENLNLEEVQDFSPKTLKNLKCLLFGINEKLKVLDILKDKLNYSEKTLSEEVSKRTKIQENFRNTCIEFLDQKKNAQNKVSELTSEVRCLTQINLDLNRRLKEFEEYKKDKELEIEILVSQAKLLESKLKPSNYQEIEMNLTKDDKVKKTEGILKLGSEDLLAIISEYEESLKMVTSENEQLRQTLNAASIAHEEILNINFKLSQDSVVFNSILLEHEAKKNYTLDQENQIIKLKKDLSAILAENNSLQSHIKLLTQNHQEASEKLYNEKFVLSESNKKLTEDYINLKSSFNSLENNYLKLQSKSYENSQTSSLSYTLLTEQNLRILQDSKDYCELTERLESALVNENTLMVINFINISENHLLLQRLLSRVLLFMRDRELENCLLRECVNQLQKQRVVYVPARGDFIDNQLANYLNSSLTPCEVPFVRIEPGIYLFGTKRVVLKVENVGICIRVGGGFIKLEDFINNQTQFEVGKLKERELKGKNSMPNSPIPKSPMPKSPMPTSPLPKSPEPQNIERISSPKFLNSPKSLIMNSPKGLIHKKSTVPPQPPQPPKVNKRKNTVL